MTSNSSLRPKLTALAWSLWAELGVSGWTRHHGDWLVDPEPLVVFTAWLADTDARLRDEVTDWCIRYGSWLSATRLANLVESASAKTRSSYGELAATVAAHSTMRWRGATKARSFKPTGRSRLESLRSPSLLSLRLRCTLGVGARAEVVRIMLAAPGEARTASDLVDEAGFKKRNIADALEALGWGGVLHVERTRNQIKSRLGAPNAWPPLIGLLPSVWPRWTRILPTIAALTDGAEAFSGLATRARSVELDKLVRNLSPSIQAAQLPEPPPSGHGGPFVGRFAGWAQRIADDLARGDVAVLGRGM